MPTNLPTELTGTVTRFKGNGRRLGYPTANITTSTDLADGVYFGFADLADWSRHPAIIFIGTPTTMGDTDRRLEAYLLNIPDKDYYGQDMKVSIEYYHRANKTFNNQDELMQAMREDEATARQWFHKR